MAQGLAVGQEVGYHSCAWGWRFGRVIGLHRDALGVNPSGLEMATVRFREERGFPGQDVALPCFRLTPARCEKGGAA